MTTTTNLGLPTWDEGNTEPNLVFNQLLAASDALVQCVVQAITATPPVGPTLGLGWIVDASPTGAWVGHVNQIAVAVTGGWKFYLPENGWAAFVVSESEDYQLVAGAWGPRGSGGGGGFANPMTTLGDLIVGGAAGSPSRLAAGAADYVFTSNGPGAAPAWKVAGSGSGVPDVNGVTGSVEIVAGAGATVTTSGSTITIASTGGGSGASTYHGGFTDPTVEDGDFIVRKVTGVTDLAILFIGDSITSGQEVTTAPVGPCATDLSLGVVTVTGVNEGVPGSKSGDWLPGSTNYNAAVTAGSEAGARIAHIMLGTNDSGGTPVTQAAYRANMIDLCDGLITLGYIVVVSYPPYAPDHIVPVTSYCRAIDSLVDNFHIFQGDTQAQDYFRDNPDALQSDDIHPTQDGSNYLAGLWAQAMQALVNGITNAKVLQRATLGGLLTMDYTGTDPILTNREVLRVPFIGATESMQRRLAIPFGMTIEGWEILADVSGSVQLDIYAGAYADYPPDSSDSICASAKPAIVSGVKAKSSTLTGWTVALDDDSTIIVNVDSITTIADFELTLRCVHATSSPAPEAVTWNPLDKGALLTLSFGNLVATVSPSAGDFNSVRATRSRDAATAAHYFKVTVGDGGEQTTIGVANSSATLTNFVGSDTNGWACYGNDGGGLHGGSHHAYGATFGTSGDEILFVLKSGSIFWRLNGTWQGSGNPLTGVNPAYTSITGDLFPAVGMLNSGQTATADFSTVDGDAKLVGCSPWQS